LIVAANWKARQGRGCDFNQYSIADYQPGILTKMMVGEPLSSIRISVKDGEFNYQFE